jgi:predicted RNase H-like nuclease
MRYFEEITRHRLLQGIMPSENLYSPNELDALIAAYTAWMAAVQPESTVMLGDPQEGQAVLPVAALKRRY